MSWGDSHISPSRIHTREQFGRELSAAATELDLSIRQVAKHADAVYGTISGWFSGGSVPEPHSPHFTPVLKVLGYGDADVVEWHSAAQRIRNTPRPASPNQSPYRGLDPFDSEHSPDFFGRAELTGELLDQVRAGLTSPGVGIVVVIGPSGAGKSSLLRAGLAVAFEAPVIFHPGEDPPAALSAAVAGCAFDSDEEMVLIVDQCEELWTLEPPEVDGRDQLHARWAAARTDFLTELSRWARRPRCVVVVGLRGDYFGVAAADPLLQLGLRPGHQIVVKPMNRDELRDVIVEPAKRRQITVQPALVSRLLEELGVTDTGSNAGALPLLSHALQQAWGNLRPPRATLTYLDYHNTGGIRGAVEQTAEQIYGSLDDVGKLVTRRVMTRSVVVTDDSTARRTAGRGELAWDDVDPTVVETVISRFAAERLLTFTATGVQISHEALLSAWQRFVDWIERDRVSLLRHRRLSSEAETWDTNGRHDKELMSAGRTEEYMQWSTDESRRHELNPIERQFLDASAAYNTAAAERDRRLVEDLRRTVARLAVSQRRLAMIAVSLFVVALLAVVAGVYALNSRDNARDSAQAAQAARDDAFSRQAAVQSELIRGRDPALAQQLALAGYHTAPTVEARSALLDSTAVLTPLRTPTVSGSVATAVDSTGSLIAVANSDGTVRIIDRRQPRRTPVITIPVSNDSLFAIAFSPDDTRLAVGGTTGAVIIDLTGEQDHKAPLPGTVGPVYDLNWSPDGREIAAATHGGTLRWSLEPNGSVAATEPLYGSDSTAKAVAYSPDGTLLATGGDTAAIQLWIRPPGAPPTLAAITRMPLGTDGILDLHFDPRSSQLAVGSQANEITVIDVTNPDAPTATGHLGHFSSFVNSVEFSADGSTIAAGSSDNSTQLFDVATGAPTQVLPGPAVVTSVHYAGDTLVGTSTDGIVHEWNLPGPVTPNLGARIYTLPASTDGRLAAVGLVAPAGSPANTVHIFDLTDANRLHEHGPALTLGDGSRMSGVAVLSDDGRTVAAGTLDGNIYTWDISSPATPRPLAAPIHVLDVRVSAAVFTPNSRYLFAASYTDDTNQIAVVDRTDPAHPTVVTTLYAKGPVQLMSVSADGNLLAASTPDRVMLWDISNGPISADSPVELTGFASTVTSVRFGTGRILAAGSEDKTIRIWDVTDPDTHPELARLTGPAGAVESLTFNASGTRLAAGIGDDQIWVWDTTDPSQPVRYLALNAYNGRVNDVAFGPGGTRMTAAGPDGTLRTWDAQPERITETLCAASASLITNVEWAQYFPNTPYADPCN